MTGLATRTGSGVWLCVVGALGFGATATFAKLADRAGVNVVTVLALRFVLASVLLGPVAVRRGDRSLDRRAAAGAIVVGAAVLSVQTMMLFLAIQRLGAALAVILHYSYPALVVAGSVALGREALDYTRVAAVTLAICGIAVVVLAAGVGRLDAIGVLCGMGSACSYAGYLLISASIVTRLTPLRLSALLSVGVAAAVSAFGASSGQLDLHFALQGWLSVVGLATIATVIPLVALLAGVSRIGASSASIVSMLEPLVAVALAALVFGERLTIVQAAGAALTLGAVLWLQRVQARTSTEKPLSHISR